MNMCIFFLIMLYSRIIIWILDIYSFIFFLFNHLYYLNIQQVIFSRVKDIKVVEFLNKKFL
jgi:hypothetical protein